MVLTDDGGLYDMQSLASRLKVSRHSIRRWRDSGKIPAPVITVGYRCYWTHEQVRIIESCDTQGITLYHCVAPAIPTNDKPN